MLTKKEDIKVIDDIFIKYENTNPGGSIKFRPAFRMINQLLLEKKLTPSDTIIEATSGNMGIALALICEMYKIHCIIVMPEKVTKERIDMIKAYQAEVILTDGSLGIDGAINKAKELARINNYYYIDQFNNPNNPLAYEPLAYELLARIPQIDYLVCGFGTGGTIMGLGKVLKDLKPTIKIIGIEPAESPFITKKKLGLHQIYGIGINKLPAFFDLSIIDDIYLVSSIEAFEETKRYLQRGISFGISTSTNMIVAKKIKKQYPEATVVTILHDDVTKYRSVIDV